MIDPVVMEARRQLPGMTHSQIYLNPMGGESPDDVLKATVDGVGPSLWPLVVESPLRSDARVLVIAGDRYEALCAATLAQQYAVPVLHLGGGETAEVVATPDTRYRNALTLLASANCAFTVEATHRVEALLHNAYAAPNPIVRHTGSPALDALLQLRDNPEQSARQREHLMAELGITRDFVLVMYHPQPYRPQQTDSELKALLRCVEVLRHTHDVFLTTPNFDWGRQRVLDAFKTLGEDIKVLPSLGRHAPAALQNASLILGNSSAGRIEASVFGTPVLELGLRQTGRPLPRNVSQVILPESIEHADATSVALSVTDLLEPPRPESSSPWANPKGQAAKEVVETLQRLLEHDKERLETW